MTKVSSSKPLRDTTNPRQNAITNLGRAMASTLDLETIFQEFAKGIKAQIRYDHLEINRIKDESRITPVFVLSPFGEEAARHPSMPYEGEDCVTAWAVPERNPIVRKDTRSEKSCETDKRLSQMGLRSYISVPLIHEGRVVGDLHIASRRPRAYGKRDLHFIMSAAEWLARAMENGHLFRETRRLLEKQAELFEEMKRHNEELQKATEYKSQFLARMSHEIRTPLGVIIGFLDILNSGTLGTLNEEQKAAIDRMQFQSRRLQRMINDVLNLARIEGGTIPLEISTFALETIIDSLRTLADDLQRKSEIRVVWDIDPNLPHLMTDAGKLEEILQNLIVNAFKYTSEGEVRIRIKNRLDTKSIEFVVEDTGRGITPENIPRIFEGFHQIDSTSSSQGVGLGLAIVKKYLEVLKGEIHVQSEPDKGSTFRVTLPYTLEV
ncbi:MAG: ATP-binding protein [Candidatus Binatia bacterium]